MEGKSSTQSERFFTLTCQLIMSDVRNWTLKSETDQRKNTNTWFHEVNCRLSRNYKTKKFQAKTKDRHQTIQVLNACVGMISFVYYFDMEVGRRGKIGEMTGE